MQIQGAVRLYPEQMQPEFLLEGNGLEREHWPPTEQLKHRGQRGHWAVLFEPLAWLLGRCYRRCLLWRRRLPPKHCSQHFPALWSLGQPADWNLVVGRPPFLTAPIPSASVCCWPLGIGHRLHSLNPTAPVWFQG